MKSALSSFSTESSAVVSSERSDLASSTPLSDRAPPSASKRAQQRNQYSILRACLSAIDGERCADLSHLQLALSAAPMNATIDSLAPELLDHILDLVRSPGNFPLDARGQIFNVDLLAAALVSREWAETAQRVLCRDARITLDQGEALPMIPHLKYPTRQFWIDVCGSEPQSSEACDAMTAWTNAWLETNPPLHCLRMTTQRSISEDWALLGPRWSFLVSGSLRDLARLELQYCEGIMEPFTLPAPFTFHLTHLSLYMNVSPTSPNLLRALFSASRDTLSTLHLIVDCNKYWDLPPEITEAISLIRPQLYRLVVNFRQQTPQNATRRLTLGHLVNLKVLELYFRDNNTRVSLLLDQLAIPATITHLGIRLHDFGDDRLIQDTLLHPALNQLNCLILAGVEVFGEMNLVKGLMEECERRAIRLERRQDLF